MSIRRFAIPLTIVLMSSSAAIATAVEPPTLEPGTRIRVTYVPPSQDTTGPIRVPGELVAITDTDIILDTYYDSSKYIPREQVIGLERSLHEHGRGRGAVTGLGIGAAAGILIGLASGDDDSGMISFSAEEKAIILGLVMAPVGALVGYAAGSGERWEAVPTEQVRLGFGPGPRGQGGFRVVVRF